MKRILVTGAVLIAALLPVGRLAAQAPFPRTPPGANELPPGHPPVDNSPSKKPLRDFFRYGRPLGCWASFNGYSCGSFKADAGFIFGSCRTFYGEPCLKGAPPSPLPEWAGEESGYRRAGPATGGSAPQDRRAGRRGSCLMCDK
jgi:hypothetical protein